jgi:hypothetical protein
LYRQYAVRQAAKSGGKNQTKQNFMHARAISVVEQPQQYYLLQKLMVDQSTLVPASNEGMFASVSSNMNRASANQTPSSN